MLDLTFSLERYWAGDVITALDPDAAGIVMSRPYAGESFDPSHFQVIPGGWDHDHCLMCRARVVQGDPWWVAEPPHEVGLCPDCHSLLEQSRPGLQAAKLTVGRAMDRRRAFDRGEVTTGDLWVRSGTPRSMLLSLKPRADAGEINRKLRLFACACVRQAWDILSDDRSRAAVEVAEAFADGLVGPEALVAAGYEAERAAGELYVSGGLRAADEAREAGLIDEDRPAGAAFGEKPGERAWVAACAASHLVTLRIWSARTEEFHEEGAWFAALNSAADASKAIAEVRVLRSREGATRAMTADLGEPPTATDPIAGAAVLMMQQAANKAARQAGFFYEDHRQASLLRCVFGNPFHPTSIDPSWRNPDATALAAFIDDLRSFDRLPDLADALEQAGCRESAVLDHCREPGEHSRGCWAVDAILGRPD